MYKILIVEDDRNQREFLVDLAKKTNSEPQVIGCGSYERAYSLAMKDTFSVFFIDVEIIGGNGFQLARELRKDKRYEFSPMVFITGKPDLELSAFRELHCYAYIHKPYSTKEITEVFETLVQNYLRIRQPEKEFFDMEFRGVRQRVNMGDILFVESRNRRLVLVTRFEEIKYKYMSLKKAGEQLGDSFVQVHQAFVVNRDYIVKIDLAEQQIHLSSTKLTVPIGSSYKKAVGDLF